ncbi:MAG: peptide MFS transporter [Rhizomicrobium sp.]|jgi:POT family proton-dependent oligopeptide transporter
MSTADAAPGERQLFGHPTGLTYLFATEMWERFSYYGMRAILVYTLVNYLLLHPTVDGLVGYHALKHVLEFVFNSGQPLAPQPLSSDIYGTYAAFVYLTPFIGGAIADAWIGQRYSVIIGGAIMAVGEFTLMVPQFFLLGLLLLIIGNGFFKPNISTQVGNLYKPGDSRIDRAYSIFYVGINVGATFSPLICGTLGEKYGYQWGYAAAGVGMLIGLFVYLVALRTLPQDRAGRVKENKEEKKPLTGNDWKAIIALLLLLIPGSLFWSVYEQQGNTISLFAQDLTDRRLIPGLIDWQIPATWFQAFNPAMIVLFTPLVVGLWTWQSRRKAEPSVLTKMAMGNFMLAGSYLVMVAAMYFSGHGHVSWLWLFLFFAVITLGELYFSPIGLALTARVAPAQVLSTMMGFWLMTSFFGNLLQGYIGSYFSRMDKIHFFLLCASVGVAAGVIFWLFNFPLRGILSQDAAKAAAAIHPLTHEE